MFEESLIVGVVPKHSEVTKSWENKKRDKEYGAYDTTQQWVSYNEYPPYDNGYDET